MSNTAAPSPRAIEIVDYLHKSYYQAGGFSSETSSYWQKYGKFQRVDKVDGEFKLSGVAFGDYKKKSLFKVLLGLPTRLFINRMLEGCDKAILAEAHRLAEATSRVFSYDVARMALTADLLKRKTSGFAGKRIVIIGDGYGTLGCLLKAYYPTAKITFINLGRTLAFDAYYSGWAYPLAKHTLVETPATAFDGDFNYVEAEKVSQLAIEGDLFVNIASMQEMNPTVIANYFKLIRSQPQDTLFYCCNRLEKTLPDGTVIRFSDYGWRDDDEILVDELCPWHQTAPKDRPPFVYRFDGPIQHRLVKMKSNGMLS